MFSEALRILDNNTAELMADRFKAQLENAKIEVKAVKHELKTTRKEVNAANKRAENEAMARIAADAKVAELQAQIKELKEKYELTN